MNVIEHWKQAVFETDASKHGWLRRKALFWINLCYTIVLKFKDKQLHLQSTSLAYTTLLSLVPILAVAFSVLKGFGVQNQLEPLLMQSLEPLGDKGIEIGERMLNYVNNMNFAVLGFMGIALLFWTVISLLQKVEEAFNAIWQVASIRSWSRRFSDYLSVALVGPIFTITALGVTTVVLNNEIVQRVASIDPFGWLILGIGRLMPYLLICVAFTFLYSFLTNTRVRLIPALVGGVFASVSWHAVGHLFAHLVANSSKYSTIYSSLAAVVLFIIWVNIGWLIILVGAHIARYWQNPHRLELVNNRTNISDLDREAVALDVMTLIGRAHYFDEPKWTLEALSTRGCAGTLSQVEDLIKSLQDKQLIVAVQGDPESYLPARAVETILLRDILAAAKTTGCGVARLPAVQKVIDQIDSAATDSLGEQTLKDLVLADKKRPSYITLYAEDSQ